MNDNFLIKWNKVLNFNGKNLKHILRIDSSDKNVSYYLYVKQSFIILKIFSFSLKAQWKKWTFFI